MFLFGRLFAFDLFVISYKVPGAVPKHATAQLGLQWHDSGCRPGGADNKHPSGQFDVERAPKLVIKISTIKYMKKKGEKGL